ncbi:MAG: 23S rRNA (guanosine(2251)-2'-O)-methyltransferase RlmB [Christensenellaceae bacterium]
MSDLIVGRNPVREALKSGREIDTIFLQDSAEGSVGEILRLAKTARVPIKKVPKKRLDEMIRMQAEGEAMPHQGVAARVASVAYQTLEDVFLLAEQKGEAPFLIGLDGIEDPHNLGAIVRSAEAFGAHGVVIPKRRSTGMTAVAAKAASGAQEYIPIVRVGNLAQTIEEVQKRGVFVAAADMAGASLSKSNLKGAMMLIIGAEGKGVSRLVKEKADFLVRIDMKGEIASLNASAAAAILLYEKNRQDQKGE